MQLVSFERAARAPRQRASIGAAGLGFEALEGVTQGARRLGAVLSGGASAGAIVDLNRALAVKLAAQDVGAPEAEANSLLPADALGFARRWPDAEHAARDVMDWVERVLARYDTPDLVAAGVVTPRRDVRLAAPVPRPGKIVGVLANYGPDGASARAPSFFLEAPSALAGPEDELRLTQPVPAVRFEGGLAVVIGRCARAVGADDALECVLGYCTALDFEIGAADTADTLARSRDGSTLLGPALVTRDEIPDPHDVGIRVQLSRKALHVARSKEMLFSLAELLALASARVTLEPGDLLLTGGPCCTPQRPLRDGDVVEVEIERVGKLATYVRVAGEGT